MFSLMKSCNIQKNISKTLYGNIINKSNTLLKYNFSTTKNENTNPHRYNPEINDKTLEKFQIIDKFPLKIQYYLKLGRYDRPIGYMLLFWPCAWGLTLGTPILNYEYFKCLSLFLTGSILMRSSGCIINDIWDTEIDKKVIRSQDRPLASNKISKNGALLFLSAHLALSLCVLLQLPKYSIIAGLAIMPVVIMYPYMKRITNFPQFFLGLAFNSGVIVSVPALTGILNWQIVIPLYCAGILWTLIYDTIYAHMDKLDDLLIKVKSTAIYFGENTKMILFFLNLIMMGLFYLALFNSEKNKKLEISSSMLLLQAGLFQIRTIYKVNLSNPTSCLKYFKANTYFGLVIFMACICSNIYSNTNKQLNK